MERSIEANSEVSDQPVAGEGLDDNRALRKKRRREERLREREAARQWRARRQITAKVLFGVVGLAGAALATWLIARAPREPRVEGALVSEQGIHWHANLAIVIGGQPVTIPANIGIGGVHADMHTHIENDQIHVEINRPVRDNDVRLGKFFEVWGEKFDSQCVLDVCNAEGRKVKLLVNGAENSEFENYRIKDGDRIEIRYE